VKAAGDGEGEELTEEELAIRAIPHLGRVPIHLVTWKMMVVGGVKTQKRVQFLCPKMDHLSVVEKFSTRTPKVTKKFRFLYNKGVVHDDGTITSFYN